MVSSNQSRSRHWSKRLKRPRSCRQRGFFENGNQLATNKHSHQNDAVEDDAQETNAVHW